MNADPDRLYNLLPYVYRQRDAERGWPLKALLRVIGEQAQVLKSDLEQLYDNWFIETCEDWVVPYLGDLVGYVPVAEAGEPEDPATAEGRAYNRILFPRGEVANTVRYRRRKGTLALLELLADDAAGWPARAVEFHRLLAQTAPVRLLVPALVGLARRGRTADLRLGDALDRLDGPFDELAHRVDVRRVDSHRTPGRYNIPSVGLFVWRLAALPVTRAPAYCLDKLSNYYTFSVLGNDTPLFGRARPQSDPTAIAGEANVPAPIRRRALRERLAGYYGEKKSLAIWEGRPRPGKKRPPIARRRIVVADLSGFRYSPPAGKVAVDPELGRLAFHPDDLPERGVWVSYLSGSGAPLGGGEYPRKLAPPAAACYRVGLGGEFKSLRRALRRWRRERPERATIEILDNAVYAEPVNLWLRGGQSLELRAAQGARPVLRLLDRQSNQPDALRVGWPPPAVDEDGRDDGTQGVSAEVSDADGAPAPGARLTLDGLVIVGRGVRVHGHVAQLDVRHTTLVPGWSLLGDSRPEEATGASLELRDTPCRVRVRHSILGTIEVRRDEVTAEPNEIDLRDSILDATDLELPAVGARGRKYAHARLSLRRVTVLGRLLTHAIELAEESILAGRVTVARRQLGCIRFCYVPPGSFTPRRYHCQPDLAAAGLEGNDLARAHAAVRPRFASVRYGLPAYGQLATTCPEEIRRGAEDRSEMGAFHDLFQPQRAAILRARLAEYTPAGMEAGLIFAT